MKYPAAAPAYQAPLQSLAVLPPCVGLHRVNRSLNMFTLIAMGTGVVWVYGLVATIAPGVFPDAFRGAHGEVSVYFETVAVITVLVLLDQALESNSYAAMPRWASSSSFFCARHVTLLLQVLSGNRPSEGESGQRQQR